MRMCMCVWVYVYFLYVYVCACVCMCMFVYVLRFSVATKAQTTAAQSNTDQIECTVCHVHKMRQYFPESLRHHLYRAHRRCLACETCSCCQTQRAGKQFEPDNSICQECATRKCSGCGRKMPRAKYNATISKPQGQYKHKGICPECLQLGRTNIDTSLYVCIECGGQYGRRRFNEEAIYNLLKRQQGSVVCTECEKNKKTRT